MFLDVSLKQKGFTLIEVLSVIIILTIVALIAFPTISGVIQNQRDKAILSDIVQLVETSRIQLADDKCENQICEYSSTSNTIGFYSKNFTEGKVDFSGGIKPEDTIITVNIDPDVFKGRNQEIIRDLFIESDGFTELQLLDVLNN